MSIDAVYCLLPELILVVAATLIYVVGAFVARPRVWGPLALVALVLSAVALWRQYSTWFWPDAADHAPALLVPLAGPLLADLLAQYVRWLALLAAALLTLVSLRAAHHAQRSEYLGTLLAATAGLMLVGSAGDLVLVFLGLELISIPTYVLLYLGRRDDASQEAAAKYFYLSILSSALMLYGFSFLYGAAGAVRLDEVRAALAALEPGAALVSFEALALVFIVAGLGFKVAAAPFHFYAPDVYQGTTHGNAGLLAVFPKIAGFVALVRVVLVAMPGAATLGWRVALILAVLTMTLGNVLALWQDNVRRLLAYSSIAQAGYLLIGAAAAFAAASGASQAADFDGTSAMLFYLGIYTLATIGAFAALSHLGGADRQVDGVDELAGLGRTHPRVALVLAVSMFSLAGIPPLAGFWGKFTLFASALGVDAAAGGTVRDWFIGLAVVGVLNAAIAAAYYLRVVAVMYFRPPLGVLPAQGGRGALLAAVVCATLVVALGCLPNALLSGAEAARRAALLPLERPQPAAQADRPAGPAADVTGLGRPGGTAR